MNAEYKGVSPSKVLAQVAAAVPTEVHPNIIIIGSLAAGYWLLRGAEELGVRTKDIDCGLAAALAGIKSSTDLASRMDAGFWLEQTLFQTLQTWRALEPQRRKLHFWRDRAGHEVDFILEQDGKLVALEVKAGSQVTTSDATGLRAFRDSMKRKTSLVRGVIMHGGKARPLDTDDVALPWGWMVPKTQ